MSGRDDLLHGTLAKTWGGHAPPESSPMPWKSTLHPCNGVRSVSGPWRIAKKRRPRSYGRGLRCAPSLSGSPVSYPEGATPAPDYTSSRNLITKVLDFVQFGGPKPKPRWDVHLPGAGNRVGSLAGVFRALDCRTVRQRRLTSSFRLDRPARNLPTLSPAYAGAGSAPPPCCPGTDCQWPPLSPSPR